jgi:6-pyruvoyl tetrahydropterin synthase-like protein
MNLGEGKSDHNNIVFRQLQDEIEKSSGKGQSKELDNKCTWAYPGKSYITMKIVAFLNARHYMVFADKKGMVHGHSWQLQAEVKVPVKDDSFIRFEDLDKLINKLLFPYQKSVLNEVDPFDQIEPLTENITVYFFNLLYDTLKALEVHLLKLTVWENPTKGIEIDHQLPRYFGSQEPKLPVSRTRPAINEAAASSDRETLNLESENFEQVINEILNRILRNNQIPEKQVDEDNPSPNPGIISGTPIDNNSRELSVSNDYSYVETSSREYSKTISGINIIKFSIAVFIIAGAASWVYWPLLGASLNQVFPWGFDTWGHLIRAEYLWQQIIDGNYYPLFIPDWYNGCQPLGYFALLPYYAIAFINSFTPNIFVAGNYYIFAVALLGSLSCLLFARKIGLWPAVALGIIWVIWPDNLRIALAQGDLPRFWATALLPLFCFTFVKILEDKGNKWALSALILTTHVLILSHASIAIVFIISIFLFGFFLWILGGCGFTKLIQGIGAIILGVISVAWWLLPKLPVLLQSAVTGIHYVSPGVSFNPMIRFNNGGEFYWGIALAVVSIISLLYWQKKPTWAKSLLITGYLLVILSFPVLSWLHQTLPLSNILAPLLFSSSASFALIVASFAFSKSCWNNNNQLKKSFTVLVVGLFIFLLIDGFFLRESLVETREEPHQLIQLGSKIKESEGWRVATLDLGTLESTPLYIFADLSRKEQVMGWGSQGVKTEHNITLLNTALEYEYYPFIFRQLANLGATDLVVKDSIVKDIKEFGRVAHSHGFKHQDTIEGIAYWNKEQSPYIIAADQQCLAIGKYADNYAIQFPAIEIACSELIDYYTIEYLQQYPQIILAGAQWGQKDKAEQLILDYVEAGGRVIIDFTGFPADTLSRNPKFLGVYTDTIELKGGITVKSSKGDTVLGSFSQQDGYWRSLVPQSLDGVEMFFDYMGNNAALYGYKYYGDNKICFLGANLAYYSFTTKDPAAQSILEEILGLSIYTVDAKTLIPLTSYQSNNAGYHMTYQGDQKLEAVIPIAAQDVMEVRIDNNKVAVNPYENLIRMHLPEGSHSIDIKVKQTPLFYWGRIISCITIGMLLLYFASRIIRRQRKYYFEKRMYV